MEFLQLAEKRFSTRSFSDKKIGDDVIEKILKAGQVAPTACNRQPQRIYAIVSDEGLAKLRKCTGSHYNSPHAFLVCYDRNECWKREFDGKESGDIDASIVCTHMMLEATELGVGSTWVMHYIPEAVRTEFELPDELESTAILVMGYPADNVTPSPRHFDNKLLTDTVRFV